MEPPVIYGCSTIDNYEIIEKLGEGTFGEVQKARHRPTSELVALKEILLHKKDDGMPITALREIRILKHLQHPNIIELLDMAARRGTRQQGRRSVFWMVTPYMDHDLAGLFGNSDVRFKLPIIKYYLHEILLGMGYLHAQNFMHRDIKAANILVDNLGRVKLADFGLARKFLEAPPTIEGATPATHRYTSTVVTRWYRPPELLMGEQFYTTAIDMWGVGCVFGEFFKRKPILPGKSDEDQLVLVFKLMGLPTEDSMPGFTSLPGAKAIDAMPKFEGTLNELFSTVKVPPDALDLLAGLLRLDPLKRLTAAAALEHQFFRSEPQMATPETIPKYESSHEMDARRRHEQEAVNQPVAAVAPIRPAHDEVGGHNRQRRRTLGYKISGRPMLNGIDCVAPYRRPGQQNARGRAPLSGLDY